MAKKKDIQEQQNIDKSNEVQIKNKRVENIITVFGVIIVLIVAAFGLWKLSGEDNKPSKQLVFTVGDQEVYQDEVNLCIIQNTIDLGVSAEHLDTATAEDGTLAADYYKQQILDVIMDYKVEYMIAKKQGLTLTEQEEKEVLLDVVEYMGKVDARVLNQWGVTQELIEEVYKQRYLARKLETEVLADVDVDEVTYCTVYLMLFPKLQMNGDGSYVTEEDGETPVMLAEDAIAQRKKDAESALEELKAGGDPAEIAKKYGVEAYSSEESNTPETFGEPFSDYAKKLKNGECTPVLDIESCYAIMQMVKVNNEQISSEIREYYQADMKAQALEDKRTEWYEQLGVGQEPVFEGKIWEKISLYDYVQ